MTLKQKLQQTLAELLQAIEAGPNDPGKASGIAGLVRQIDAIRLNLDGDTPKKLLYFLEKRSYPKALKFVKGWDEASQPNG